MTQPTFQEFTCSCQQCKDMCQNPCIPTVDEAKVLIERGYSKYLRVENRFYWPRMEFAPHNETNKDFGYEEEYRVDIILPKRANSNIWFPCIFLDDNQYCKLHKPGLKPLEGRVAFHDGENSDYLYAYHYLLMDWNTDRGRALVRYFQENEESHG